MTIVSGDILRCVASMLWDDGNVVQNVFNCEVSGGGSPFDDDDVIDDIEDWMDDMYANLTIFVNEDLDGNTIHTYKYDSGDDDWDEVGSSVWNWLPSAAGDQLPRGVAGLARLWTSDPDVQGKKYLPGFAETDLVDGLYSGALLVAILLFAADWYTPFVGAASGATFTPGVWSVVGSVFRAAVEHYAASAIPAYQRRRKRGVGI